MFQLLRIPSKFSIRSLSTSAFETRYTHIPRVQELPEAIAPVFSIDSTDAKEAFKAKKREYINKYQSHQLDVGSSQIQGTHSTVSLLLPLSSSSRSGNLNRKNPQISCTLDREQKG
jgi:hypothetical protein